MVRDLHVGLILALTIRGLAVTSYHEMRRVAALAEELGFDSIWLCDHFLTLPTVEGPILRDLESHADYPAEVAEWYETMAREVMRALDETARKDRVAADDALWSGPRPGEVGR